jgi:hypothetical protein
MTLCHGMHVCASHVFSKKHLAPLLPLKRGSLLTHGGLFHHTKVVRSRIQKKPRTAMMPERVSTREAVRGGATSRFTARRRSRPARAGTTTDTIATCPNSTPRLNAPKPARRHLAAAQTPAAQRRSRSHGSTRHEGVAPAPNPVGKNAPAQSPVTESQGGEWIFSSLRSSRLTAPERKRLWSCKAGITGMPASLNSLFTQRSL